MGVINNLIDDVRDFFSDPFKNGVLDTSNLPVVFIDPDKLRDPDMNKNIETYKKMLEDQAPGTTRYATPDNLRRQIEQLTTNGPLARLAWGLQGKVCVVTQPGKRFDEKHEMVELISGRTKEELGYIPGTDSKWQRAVGVHEGEHCNQKEPKNQTELLQNEASSDRKMIAYLESRYEFEMTQAMKDYRAIDAAESVARTSPLLDDKTAKATPEHDKAANNMTKKMVDAVKEELGLNSEDTLELLKNNSARFFDTVDRLVSEGKFDGNPLSKKYIVQFSEGVRRQILDPDPPKPIDVLEETQSSSAGDISGQDKKRASDTASAKLNTETTIKAAAVSKPWKDAVTQKVAVSTPPAPAQTQPKPAIKHAMYT